MPLLAVGLFVAFAATANFSSRQFNDAGSAFTAAWSLTQRGTLDISDVQTVKAWTVTVGEAEYSDRFPGIIIFAAPFYLLLGVKGMATVYPAGIASATAATTAMVLLFLLFRRLSNERTGLLATLLVAFGTSVWTVSADSLWPQGVDQVCLIAAMLLLSSAHYTGAGLAWAYAVFTRPHQAVIAAVCGIAESWRCRSARPLLAVGAASSLGVLGLLLYNYFIFGRATLLAGVYGTRLETAGAALDGDQGSLATRLFDLPLVENVAGTLVSPVRGVLILSPFLLLLIPGIKPAWAVAPLWVRSSAVGGLVYTAVQLTGNHFSGGTGFYSYRLAIEPLTVAAPLLLLAWQNWTARSRWRRWCFGALAIFSVVQHAVGAFAHYPGTDPRQLAWNRYLLVSDLLRATTWQLMLIGTISIVILTFVGYLLWVDFTKIGNDSSQQPCHQSEASSRWCSRTCMASHRHETPSHC